MVTIWTIFSSQSLPYGSNTRLKSFVFRAVTFTLSYRNNNRKQFQYFTVDAQNAELRARVSIIGQRKARLLQSATRDSAEAKRLKATIESTEMDMRKLNELIGKSGRQE